MSTTPAPVPELVAPGTFGAGQLARIEDIMNATVREAVFVTEHLDSGDVQSAIDSLIQIRMNADSTIEKIEKLTSRKPRPNPSTRP